MEASCPHTEGSGDDDFRTAFHNSNDRRALRFKLRERRFSHFAKSPQTTPPISPRPRIGAYFFVIIASGKLRTSPTSPPLSQLGMGSSILKIINPIANLLIKEAVIALGLFSKVITNIGMIETIPKISPAIVPLMMLFIDVYSFLSFLLWILLVYFA
jgi:hypothetical protein